MNFLLALLVAAGFGGWTFYQLQRSAGAGNEKRAAMGAGVAFLVAFLVIFSLSQMLLKPN